MKYKVDLKGCCVTREALEYNKDYVEVKKYIFQKPVITMATNPIEVDEEFINDFKLQLVNSNLSNFGIRSNIESLRKKYWDNYEKKDFFLLDFIDERMKLIEVEGIGILEYKGILLKKLKEKFNVNVYSNNFNLFKVGCNNLFKELLKYYKEEEIVLHKAFAINKVKYGNEIYYLEDFFRNKEKNIYEYYSNRSVYKINKFYNNCYDYILEKWPNIKIIEIDIDRSFLDIDHRLGRNFYHYTEDYYKEFMTQLNFIVKGNYEKSKIEKVSKNNKKILNKHNDEEQLINTNVGKEREKKYLYPNGNTKIIEKYIGYNLISKKTFSEDNILLEESIYINGELQKNNEFHRNGKVKRILTYDEFNLLGQIYTDERFDFLGRREEYAKYFSTGEIQQRNYYYNGKLLRIDYFNKRNEIIKEKKYINGKIYKELVYKDNIIEKSVEYFDNGIQSEIIKFNRDGSIKAIKSRSSIDVEWSDKVYSI